MTRTHTGPDDLRVGIVGLGWFGRIHLDAWASVRGASVVGLCDIHGNAFDSERRSAQDGFHTSANGTAMPRLPQEMPTYRHLDDLLGHDIDLLDVVTTEAAHETCVRQGLNADVDVVVEKPLALDYQAAADLIGLAERTGRNLYVGHLLRFDPRHIALADEVRDQTLRHISLARVFQPTAHRVYGRAHPALNAAVHDIDLAIWLAGSAPCRVTAFGSAFLGGQHPDALDLVLEWDGGLRAVIQNSWHLAASCPYGFIFECRVETDRGTYRIRNEPVLESWTDWGVAAPEMFFWPRYGNERHGALVDELRHVADCARRGQPSNRVPLAQVLAVVQTAQAAIDAAETGAPQELTHPTAPRPGRRHG